MAEESRVLYSEDEIKKRVTELAETICDDYQGKKPVLVGILKGSVVFLSDLLRRLYVCGLQDVEVDFMTVSSYGSGKEYQGSTIVQDITLDVSGKDIILIEDIIDTGHTLSYVFDHLKAKQPSSVSVATLLDKKDRREVAIDVSYTGFTLTGSPWVEGYGLDSAEIGRGRPEVIEKTS